MHALLEVHDTAESAPPQPVSRGIGVRSIDQVVPFQCSTNGIGLTVDGSTDGRRRCSRSSMCTTRQTVRCRRSAPAAGPCWIDQSAAAAD